MLHEHFAQDGFLQSLADQCVYVKTTESGHVVAIAWVDDIIIAGSNRCTQRGKSVPDIEIQDERPRGAFIVLGYSVQVQK